MKLCTGKDQLLRIPRFVWDDFLECRLSSGKISKPATILKSPRICWKTDLKMRCIRFMRKPAEVNRSCNAAFRIDGQGPLVFYHFPSLNPQRVLIQSRLSTSTKTLKTSFETLRRLPPGKACMRPGAPVYSAFQVGICVGWVTMKRPAMGSILRT